MTSLVFAKVLLISLLTTFAVSTQTTAETLPDECDLYANECVPLNDCPVLNTLLLGAGNLITPDIAEKLQMSQCLNSTKVCCPKLASKKEDDIEVELGSRFADESCTTPRQQSGICTPIRKCASIYQILQKGRITSDESNYLRGSQCDYQNRTPYVCCPDAVRPTNMARPTSNEQRGQLLPSYDQCGVFTTDKIIGGTTTKVDEFPWLGLIQYTDKQNNGRRMFGCGSSLINNRYVVTAAHCVNTDDIPRRYQPTLVRLGEWDTSTDYDCDTSKGTQDCVDDPVQDIAIEKIVVHESYRKSDKNVHHDIALIRLRQPATFNFFVSPICLPRTDELKRKNLVDSVATVAGWGITEHRVKSSIKLKVDLGVTSNADCQRAFSSRTIAATQVCAGGEEGKDSCGGDSGGPLMSTHLVGRKQISYLIGLVSYGAKNCGSRGLPGVYTRIGEYMTWIENNVRE